MPRIASLYPAVQPSSGTLNNRHPRTDHKSHIRPPPNPGSHHRLRFARTSLARKHTVPKQSIFSGRSQTAPAASWKSKLGFLSHPIQRPPQPLTLEEKLRVAAGRIQRFEHQDRPEDRPEDRPQTKPHSKAHSRTHAGTQLTTKNPIRKRDKLQTRLSTFVAGRF